MGINSSVITSNNTSSEQKQAIRSQWEVSLKGALRRSQDGQLSEQVFSKYDTQQIGALEHDQAIDYIHDLLEVSSLNKRIQEEAKSYNLDSNEYYEKYVENIFQEMDINKNGKIEFEEWLNQRPSVGAWEGLMNLISIQTRRFFIEPSEDESSSSFDVSISEEEYEWDDQELITDINEVVKNVNSISVEDMKNMRINMMTNVKELTGMDKHLVMALLNKYNWDKTEFLSAYFDDPETVLKQANVAFLRSSGGREPIVIEEKEIDCSICWDITDKFTVLPGCGHVFCDACWDNGLSVEIINGKTIEIRCMENNCNMLVPEEIVMKTVKPEVYEKYQKFLNSRFIENNLEIRWCPSPNCEAAVYEPIVEGDCFVGICECGIEFCWKCGLDNHAPASCEDVEEFLSRGDSEDLKTKKWLQENTKKCPQCKNPIQKNDGCFHMTCSQCYHQFCWLCSQDWSTHNSSFSCSRYQDGVLQDKPEFRDDENQNDYLLDKFDQQFMHYAERYHAYKNSVNGHEKNESNIADLILRIEHMYGEYWSPDYLFFANNRLTACRKYLQYISLQLAVSSGESDIFNKFTLIQDTLEIVTEQLANIIERDLESEEYTRGVDWDLELKNIAKIADQCINNVKNI
eukprot:TRINITY_DN7918_c0_g6_i1.p1 TRINITY_DN7918_c0_g6~~TRINITY_DN7918_c0_g6_i1.p1  ORF type:complete len:643 (+),score=141.50 TRINITY_DN7918_c0_g6_i1:44-1930(+)